MFKFIKNPEFVKSGARILFREGRTKGIGQVTQVSLATILPQVNGCHSARVFIDYVLHLCIIKSLKKNCISHFAFIMIEYSNCIKKYGILDWTPLFRCFHLSTMQIDKFTHFIGGFTEILPSCEIVSAWCRFLVPSEVLDWGAWSDFESKVCPDRSISIQSVTHSLLMSHSLWNLSNFKNLLIYCLSIAKGRWKSLPFASSLPQPLWSVLSLV